jgi:hypothetical protein
MLVAQGADRRRLRGEATWAMGSRGCSEAESTSTIFHIKKENHGSRKREGPKGLLVIKFVDPKR